LNRKSFNPLQKRNIDDCYVIFCFQIEMNPFNINQIMKKLKIYKFPKNPAIN